MRVRPLRTVLRMVALAMIASACGGDEPQPRTLACPDDLPEITEALGSGLPTYDYNPADDLEALVARVDLVVSGSLVEVVRVPDASGSSNAATRFRLEEHRVVARGGTHSSEDAAFGGEFSTGSWWAQRNEPDPIEATLTVEGVRALVLLIAAPQVPGGFGIDVQGLHIACDANVEPLQRVIEPLPLDAVGTPLRTLEAILAAE